MMDNNVTGLLALIRKNSQDTNSDFALLMDNFLDYMISVCEGSKPDNPAFARLSEEWRRCLDKGDKVSDMFGEVYEAAFVSKFKSSGNGQFFTPECLARLCSRIVSAMGCKDAKVVGEPTCGSGRMMLELVNGTVPKDAYCICEDIDPICVKMCTVNMCLNGLRGCAVCHNTLMPESFNFGYSISDHSIQPIDWSGCDIGKDVIISNPPFNLSDWGLEKMADDKRWKFGTPPSHNANYAWIQHIISDMSDGGCAAIVMANGSLSSTCGEEGKIRERIARSGILKAIIALPDKLFLQTGIPICLWLLKKDELPSGKMLFIDARKCGKMADRRLRTIEDSDIDVIAEKLLGFFANRNVDEKGKCKAVGMEEISANDFVLTPGRYVGIPDAEDDGISFDDKMRQLTTELSELLKESHRQEDEIRRQLAKIGYEI